jgi:hypothetical protein
MPFLAVLLGLKLFLSFFQPLDLPLLKLLTDFRPFARLPPDLVFSVIFAILISNVGSYCRLKVYKKVIAFFLSIWVPPFFEYS